MAGVREHEMEPRLGRHFGDGFGEDSDRFIVLPGSQEKPRKRYPKSGIVRMKGGGPTGEIDHRRHFPRVGRQFPKHDYLSMWAPRKGSRILPVPRMTIMSPREMRLQLANCTIRRVGQGA